MSFQAKQLLGLNLERAMDAYLNSNLCQAADGNKPDNIFVYYQLWLKSAGLSIIL